MWLTPSWLPNLHVMQGATSSQPDKVLVSATGTQPNISRPSLVNRLSFKQDETVSKASEDGHHVVQLLESASDSKTPRPVTPENTDKEHPDDVPQQEFKDYKNSQNTPALAPEAPLKDAIWPLVAGTITVILLVALATLAGKSVDNYNKKTVERAKNSLAFLHPNALCIPGLRSELSAISDHMGFSCMKNDTAVLGAQNDIYRFVPKNPDGEWPRRVIPGRQARSIVLALHCCGAVNYFYTPDHLRTWANNLTYSENDEVFIGNMSAIFRSIREVDRRAACLTMLGNRYCGEKISDANNVYDSPDYNKTRCKKTIDSLNSITLLPGSLTSAANRLEQFYKDFKYNLYNDRSADIDYINSLWQFGSAPTPVIFAREFAVDGVLKIDTGEAGSFGSIWLNISQTFETAYCMGAHDTTSDFWKRSTNCAGIAAWLRPTGFSYYGCTDDGVNTEFSEIYSQLQVAAQQKLEGKFLQITIHGYNDLYAVYTAILGALIATFAAVFISIMTVMIQLLVNIWNSIIFN